MLHCSAQSIYCCFCLVRLVFAFSFVCVWCLRLLLYVLGVYRPILIRLLGQLITIFHTPEHNNTFFFHQSISPSKNETITSDSEMSEFVFLQVADN